MRALPKHAIVRMLPWKRDGVISIPDKIHQESTDAEMVSDGDGEIPSGRRVVVSRMEGEYFERDGQKFCTVPKNALLLIHL
jgi:hypothetical protein